MKEIASEHIVKPIDILPDMEEHTLILELMETSLEKRIEAKEEFKEEEKKRILKEILLGIKAFHDAGLVHGDIRASNVLFDANGTTKIGDLGFAQVFGLPAQKGNYMNYRSPETLYYGKLDDPSVDMWSFGCLLAGFYRPKPLFSPCDVAGSQLNSIFEVIGTPSKEEFPGIEELQKAQLSVAACKARPWEKVCRGEEAKLVVELLPKLISLEPGKRISAAEALESEYFK